VNHFNKAAAITTKVGLCHNLKNLIWFNNVDIDTFYPRCFDLALQEELEDFIQEFKAVKAESYVKIFVKEMRESKGEKTTVPDKVLKIAMKVCDKRLKELDELIDDPNAFASLVTDEEWKVLGQDELNLETLAQKKHEDWLAKNEVMQ
jgi:tubulin monoglycylase TTLL3/8